MNISLPQLKRDTSIYELRARELLTNHHLNQELSNCFEQLLMAFFSSLSKTNPYSFWAIDDFHFQERTDSKDAVTLVGEAFWLEGGELCSVVKIDIGIKCDPLLYSFKFSKGDGKPQELYIAKSIARWFLSAG